MKVVATTAAALALFAPSRAPDLGQRDFEQIIEAAAANAASSWLGQHVHVICVRRELDPPFHAVRHWIDDFHQAGSDQRIGVTDFRFTGNPVIDRWIPAAMAPGATVAPEPMITSLPHRYVLFSGNRPTPQQCVVDHSLGRTSGTGPAMAVTLTFTRPVLAGGYVFVDEVEDCPGMCGNGILNVFEKQRGKWVEVASQALWVS